MRLSRPRLAPVEEADWSPAQEALLAPMAARRPVLNIFKTPTRDPAALGAWLGFGVQRDPSQGLDPDLDDRA